MKNQRFFTLAICGFCRRERRQFCLCQNQPQICRIGKPALQAMVINMIEYLQGDIFDSPAQVIVNTVNTVGVMGKGLALSFKQRYPQMFERYKEMCDKKMFTVGKLMLFYEADHWLLMFPTKENWRNPSKLEYIEKGLMKFVAMYANKGITSIAFPRLGCGNGELDWNDVRPLMERYLKSLPIDVYIYLDNIPDDVPEHKTQKKTMEWLRANAKDMSFHGLKDDLMALSAILPYCYQNEGNCYEMNMGDELVLKNMSTNEVFTMTEDELYSLWDQVRSSCVFAIEQATDSCKQVYGLLYCLGYLSRIKLYDSSSDSMIDGYQINSGLDRVMDFVEG